MTNSGVRWRLYPAIVKLLFGKPHQLPVGSVKSVACLRPGKLGDMIVATPLFSALKKSGGIERLSVVCSRINEIVIRHNPHIDDVRVVNFHSIRDVLAAVAWLRRQRFDAVIDLTPGFSRTNFLMSYCAGPHTQRVGIEKEQIAGCYHINIGNRESHLADRMLEAGEALTGRRFPQLRRFELYAAQNDKAAAMQFVNRQKGRLAAINLSAGNRYRQWTYERYAGLLSLFAARGSALTVALIAVGEQRAWAERLAVAYDACVVVPDFSFLTIAEVLGACSLLISPDTALVHAAGAKGVPVVGLYNAYNENLVRWSPYRIRCKIVQSSTESVSDIEPGRVYDAAVQLLEEIAGRDTVFNPTSEGAGTNGKKI